MRRTRLVDTLCADDFAKLRKHLARGRRGAVSVCDLIARIRVLFKFAVDRDLVEELIRGINVALTKPSNSVLRKERHKNGGSTIYTPEQIHQLLAKASPIMRAMVLLGINCGLGNTDVANLEAEHINGQWLDYPRPKTGILRRSKLWPETLDAIRQAGGLPFRTMFGGAWVNGTDNEVSKEFRKLLDACGINTHGMNFPTIARMYGIDPQKVRI